MGIYDLGSANTLKKVQQEKALPPIEVSDKDEVLKSLGDKAAEGGFQPIAVHNVPGIESPTLGSKDCERIDIEHKINRADKSYWKDHDAKYGPLIYKQLAEAFDLNDDNLDFI